MNTQQSRDQLKTRSIILGNEMVRETAINLIKNLPVDNIKPIEILIREQQKSRKQDQNSLMWSGPLKDISDQAWMAQRQYSAEIWHEFLKREYLPEQYEEGITKDGYVKWGIDPHGHRVLIGSTTQLTVKGFSEYLEKVYAFGADLGVMFSAGRRYE